MLSQLLSPIPSSRGHARYTPAPSSLPKKPLGAPTRQVQPQAAIDVHVPELASGTYVVYAKLPARLYHAAFPSNARDHNHARDNGHNHECQWASTGLSGTLVFGKDTRTVPQTFWFRLLAGANADAGASAGSGVEGRTIWLFRVPESAPLEYRVDKPFFHVFNGSSRKFGFLLTGGDDREAEELAIVVKESVGGGGGVHQSHLQAEKVAAARSSIDTTKSLPRSIRSRLANVSSGFTRSGSPGPNSAPPGPIAPTSRYLHALAAPRKPTISAPTASSFVHVAHIGNNAANNNHSAAADDSADSDLDGGAWTVLGGADTFDGTEFGFRPPTVFFEQHDIADGYIKASRPAANLRPVLILPQPQPQPALARTWPGDVKQLAQDVPQAKMHRIRRKPSPRLSTISSESPAS
ncbi:CRIB domain-containing protein [Mycena chlorophos]|uniref:CRIB domain-containing protein n=1 Tax=Mycena chlorophos TaxID=658473 RepID=A0A8H6TLA8_MYCCL|nr:CRIB domain-containing protein [Mycena chlorophos]